MVFNTMKSDMLCLVDNWETQSVIAPAALMP
jgi:hypothetical protein